MKRLFLPICLVLVACGCLAQSSAPQADSLTAALKAHPQEDSIHVQLLIDLIRSVIYRSPDSAMRYSNEVLRISGKTGLRSGIAFGYRYKGLVYYLNGDYVQALDYLQQALKAAESLHSKKFDASMFNNLAIVYMELKQYGKALSYYQKYLSASRELGLPEEEAKALLNIGNLYGETDDVDNGLIYCNQSLSLSLRNGYSVVTASALNSLAILYKKKKDYPAAIGAFQKSIDLSRKMGNLFNEATALNGAAEVYALMQDYAKAAQYASQGLAVAKQVNALKWEADSWSDLSDIYAHQQQYAKALDAYRNFTVLHDSLMNDEKKQEFTRKDLQYEFDKKSALVKAGNDKQQALNAAEIGRQRVVRNAVIGGGKGKLSIHVYLQDEMINYSVEDNGIGRARAAGAEPATGAARKSMGIKITGERIALINQSRDAGGNAAENARASMHLSDLEQGTRVEVCLPLALNF